MPRRSARSTPSPRTTRALTVAPQSSAPAPTPAPGSPSTPVPDPSTTTPGDTSTPETSTAVLSRGSDGDEHADTLSGVQLSPDAETRTRQLAILEALDRGTPYREIAQTHRIGVRALVELAKQRRYLDKEGVANLMRLNSLEMVDLWRAAAVTGAAAGKHAAARDYLMAAKMLDPIQSDAGNGAKVAIIIGQVGNPLSVDVAQVIDTQAVSSDTD